jgi:YVTN family beta-propeller protein
MSPARRRIPKAAIPALVLLALTLGVQAQWVEDSVEVETRWVGSLCYNPTANVVYGCGEQPGAFFAIDCSTNEVVASFPHRNALQVVHDSIDNKAYCIVYSTSDDDSILIIDGTTHARIGAIPLCWARFMVWDPVANRLYVSEFGDNSVAVIDCAPDTVIARIRTSSEPLRMHLSTGHRKLYVQCQGSDRLNIVDLNTLEVIENLRLEGMPETGCYSQAVDKYYCGSGRQVTVIDGQADTVIGRLTVSGGAYSMVAVDSHRLVMVGGYGGPDEDDTVFVFDAVSDTLVRALPTYDCPTGMCWSPLTDLVYVTAMYSNRLTVVEGNGSRVRNDFRVGRGPFVLLPVARHERVYVGHLGDSRVFVVRDRAGGIAEAASLPWWMDRVPATLVSDVLRVPRGDGWSARGAVLLDAAGRPVAEIVPGVNDVRHLPPGVYAVVGRDGRHRGKVVKVR